MGVAEPRPVPLHPGNLRSFVIHGPLVLPTYMREFHFPENNETSGNGFHISCSYFPESSHWVPHSHAITPPCRIYNKMQDRYLFTE